MWREKAHEDKRNVIRHVAGNNKVQQATIEAQ
jgi:hypothetical protein